MRYALLADIHANLPALQAALDDISGRQIDAVYHLGDLVGYAPWPDETVALLRRQGIAGVAGNYDSTVGSDREDCGCTYENPRRQELSQLSYEWTRRNCSVETKAYLAALPFRIDLRPLGGHTPGPTAILVHGTPGMNTVDWTENRPDSFCLEMARAAGARCGDVVCFGHTHRPWRREIEGVHFVNAGSVGRPKDRDWRAGYVTLDFGEGVGAPAIEFVRVEYDLGRTLEGILASGLPHEFAEHLQRGSPR